MSAKSSINIVWGKLVLDSSSERFFEQAVSLPVPECPSASKIADDVWWFPAEIASGGASNLRRVDFGVSCGTGKLTDRRHEDLLLLCKIFALLRMAKPLHGYVDLATVKRHMTVVFALCDAVARVTRTKRRRKLSDHTFEDLRDCIAVVARNWRPNAAGFEILEDTLSLMRRWGEQGHLPDWFERISQPQIRTLCGCTEKDRPPPTAPSDRHLYATPPLPVTYLAQALERADFYIKVMATPLIERVGVLAQFRREEAEILAREPGMTIWDPRRARVRYEAWAKDHRWPFHQLPFPVRYTFPANTSGELFYLLSSTQAAAIHCVGAAVAPRSSEFLAMETSCLLRSRDVAGVGRLVTLRFKGSDGISDEVEWDVPDWVERAILVQLRLGEALRAPAVWHCVHWSDWGKRLTSGMNTHLRNFAHQHYLDASMGNRTEISVQRFRPTLAREILVSPRGHIRLIQRVLGHKNVRTTEAYLRMNPFLAPDLTDARLRRIGATPPARSGTGLQVHDVAGGLATDALSEMLRQAESRGEPIHLLGPGILLTTSGDAPPDAIWTAFDRTDVRRDALAFAIGALCRREVRADASVYGWYVDEARRLSNGNDGRITYEPANAREAAAYGVVIGGI